MYTPVSVIISLISLCGRDVGSCQKWAHRKCSGIKGSMYEVMKSLNRNTNRIHTNVIIIGRVDVDRMQQRAGKAVLLPSLSILLNKLCQVKKLAILHTNFTLHHHQAIMSTWMNCTTYRWKEIALHMQKDRDTLHKYEMLHLKRLTVEKWHLRTPKVIKIAAIK